MRRARRATTTARSMRPIVRSIDGNIATSFAPGADDVGFSPQLKNLREPAICSSGLQARQAGWLELVLRR